MEALLAGTALDLLRQPVEAQGATVVGVLDDINQAARHADHIVRTPA